MTDTVAPRRETLTARVARMLGDRIMSGEFPPGSRLPTEQALIEAYGVSRTVVREAVSLLKANGLVATRQGVGAFAIHSENAPTFRIEEIDLHILNEVIAVLELRISIEVEAAALAAQRRDDDHLAAMAGALDRMSDCIARGDDAIGPDLDFHRTIAEATGNRHFTNIFNYLGALLIPRTRVQTFKLQTTTPETYLERLNDEHRAIYEAIRRRDPESSRAAMRVHLTGSRERLRAAAERQKHGR